MSVNIVMGRAGVFIGKEIKKDSNHKKISQKFLENFYTLILFSQVWKSMLGHLVYQLFSNF